MAFPRRFLPSISLLSAFEAAARHQSITAAAGELDLTQSAVSRQIRALEDIVGTELFVRERQRVRLTAAGETYAMALREALRSISAATLGLRANPSGGELNLAILPTFGTRWLAPRLSKFYARNPGITINLSTRLAPFDFQIDSCDAAIHFGTDEWPGAELDLLMAEEVVPACSPAVLSQHAFSSPEDLLNSPLLHLVSRPNAWHQWFASHGVNAGEVPGMTIDQFATAAQAAVAGLGVALLPTFLMQTELNRGELVVAYDTPITESGKYFLAWPTWKREFPPLKAFREWLQSEISTTP